MGLHDTYFLRAKYFADKKKTVESESSIRIKDRNKEYLSMRQRGFLTGLSDKVRLNYKDRIPRSEIKSIYDLNEKTDTAPKLGYSGFNIPSLDFYSGRKGNVYSFDLSKYDSQRTASLDYLL